MKIKFVDTLYGFTAGLQRTGFGDNTYDYIYRTTNGGETWIKVLDTLCWPPFGLEDIDVLDRKTAIAVGQFGKIYWTQDGGDSWQRDSNALIVNQLPPTMRVCIIDENTAIIGDYYNGIWRSYLATDVEEDKEPNQGIFLYPNPISSGNKLLLKLSSEIPDNYSLILYNALGQKVGCEYQTQETNTVNLEYDTSGLQSGIYFLFIKSRGKSIMKTFIIE